MLHYFSLFCSLSLSICTRMSSKYVFSRKRFVEMKGAKLQIHFNIPCLVCIYFKMRKRFTGFSTPRMAPTSTQVHTSHLLRAARADQLRLDQLPVNRGRSQGIYVIRGIDHPPQACNSRAARRGVAKWIRSENEAERARMRAEIGF